MRKRSLLALTMAAIVAFTMTGCGGDKKTGDNGGDSKGEEKAKLVVLNWDQYGSDDPDFVKAFEEANNCEIVNQSMASEEDLLTKLRTIKDGEIDVCLPNCTILPSAIDEGLLKEIDTTKLENFNGLFEKFKTQKECMKDGKYYAIPFVWGATGVAYNTDRVKEAPKSMNVLFDPKYKGRLTFRDDYNDAIMAAAIVTGQDPNHPTDMDAIKAKLLEQKKLNRTYWKTEDEFTKLFAGNQIDVAMMWSGASARMKLEGQPIAFVIPDDGAIGWVDNWAIAKGTKNEDLAYKFIDWMISKDFQQHWAENGGPAPVCQAAAEAMDPEYVKAAAMDEASLNKLYFMEYRTDAVKKEWNELWTEVKATN